MESGTGGIGLFRIRERLSLAGGGLEYASTPGKGSRFTVWVPAQQACRAGERPRSSRPRSSRRRR